MSISDDIKSYIIAKSNEYRDTAEDEYDFWNEHIRYVYKESQTLAEHYGADLEIVTLGALLHDIALVCKVGDKKDHHVNGETLAGQVLTQYDYPSDKKERVLKCVYNHRSSKNATTIEEKCVADADILAHFDNIPMLFNVALVKHGVKLKDIRGWMRDALEKDYNDLSPETKKTFRSRYETILDVVCNEV